MQFIIQISGPSHLMFDVLLLSNALHVPLTGYSLQENQILPSRTFYLWSLHESYLLLLFYFLPLVFAHANSNHPTPTRPPHKKRNSIQKGARPFNNPPATSTAWPFGNTTNLFEVLFCNPWNAPLRTVDWHLGWRVEK